MNFKPNTTNLTILFILFLAFYTLLPFFILSSYNHPSADDFVYSTTYLQYGFFVPQYNWYVGWSGRYIASAILSLSPTSFYSYMGYKLASFFLIVLLGSSFYFLIKQIFSKETTVRKIAISLLILVIYIYQMPKIASGFYWFAGASTYQLGNVFLLFMLGGIIIYLKTKKRKHLFFVIVALFLLIGSNETVMLLTDMILFFMALFYYTKMSRFNLKFIKNNSFLIILLFFGFVFSLIVILAPGNNARLGLLPNRHKLTAFYNSYTSAKQYVIQWLPAVSVFSLLLLSLIKKTNLNKNNWFSIHPIYAFLIMLLVTYAGFFPAHWSMGVPPPSRTINTIYLFFLLTWLYFMLTLFTYFNETIFPKTVSYVLLLTSIVLLMMPNNIQTAYQDWLSGDAKQYDLQLKERYQIIEKEKLQIGEQDTIRVPALLKKPKTIFFNDLEEKPDDWRNRACATYFKIPNIVIEKKK